MHLVFMNKSYSLDNRGMGEIVRQVNQKCTNIHYELHTEDKPPDIYGRFVSAKLSFVNITAEPNLPPKLLNMFISLGSAFDAFGIYLARVMDMRGISIVDPNAAYCPLPMDITDAMIEYDKYSALTDRNYIEFMHGTHIANLVEADPLLYVDRDETRGIDIHVNAAIAKLVDYSFVDRHSLIFTRKSYVLELAYNMHRYAKKLLAGEL